MDIQDIMAWLPDVFTYNSSFCRSDSMDILASKYFERLCPVRACKTREAVESVAVQVEVEDVLVCGWFLGGCLSPTYRSGHSGVGYCSWNDYVLKFYPLANFLRLGVAGPRDLG
jgi:hypothetical protein